MSGDLQRCYTQGQRDDQHMRGRMQVRAKVGADGVVTTAEVTEAVGLSEYVVRCVLERIRAARFPKPEGGHDTVIVPAVFEPKP
jgi:outer membrane biosynthesis protein TonB